MRHRRENSDIANRESLNFTNPGAVNGSQKYNVRPNSGNT